MEVTRTIAALSAMITPAVLIMASSSLILATSQRLGRVMERARRLNDDFKKMDPKIPVTEVENNLYYVLTLAMKRAKLLQRSLSNLYISLSLFIATSVSIGIIDITHTGKVWVPLMFGITGIFLLLYSSLLLIRESRIALSSVYKESELILTMNKRFFVAHGASNPRARMNLLNWIRRSHHGKIPEGPPNFNHRS